MMEKIVHVLCEGQTEQGFVNEVLKPYLIERGVTGVKSVIVTTNKKKAARGGVVTYHHVYDDLKIMIATGMDSLNQKHVFTTMIDFYALPDDFPGYEDAAKIPDKYRRVDLLENSLANDIGSPRFVPYIQLHEFEALLFCGVEYLAVKYPDSERQIDGLASVLEKVGNPELINDKPDSSPSKRIIKAIEGTPRKHYRYNKPTMGKFVTAEIGIEKLRSMCPHFNEWIRKLLDC